VASPSDLMRAISAATGVPLGTVMDIDRWLVKANLRTKGGRGPNAARMAPLDAARLLTALLGSPQSNEAAQAVLRYAETRPDKARSSTAMAGLDNLVALPSRHSFVDGLAALIASVSTGSLAALFNNGKQPAHIEVFAFTQATHGRIRISGLPGGVTASVEYISVDAAPRSKKVDKTPAGQPGDLEQSRRITERTILTIGGLFAEERDRAR
jgi:hypothetical protein